MRTKDQFNLKMQFIFFIFLFFAQLNYAQTSWIKYSDHPVLQRDTTYFPPSNDLIANSDPFVIKVDGTYKMWYTCGGGNYPADTLLRSRICYCTSEDGVNWTKYSNNPVIDVSYDGAWDSLGVETITVIIDSSAPQQQRYKAWFAGQYFNDYRYDIGYAWSADGINWTKHNSPVLTVGNNTAWDNGLLEGPSVIKDGNTFKMWYAAYDVVVDGQSTDGKVNIGLATSIDGINWTKYPGNPVLTTSVTGCDQLYVQDPHVIKRNGMYQMWFGLAETEAPGGFGQQTGYAYSSDGINWTKSSDNPVLKNGNQGEWDCYLASFPSVLFDDDGTLKMWYTGRDKDILPGNLNYYWEIGLAVDSSGYSGLVMPQIFDPIVVFPNPVVQSLTISFPDDKIDEKLFIYDYLGREMMEVNILQESTIINVADLPYGLYFIRFAKKSFRELKFIKN